VVLARYARNRRLGGAVQQWAFCAMRGSPGAHTYYNTLRATARAAQELHNLLTEAGFAQIQAQTLDLKPPVAGVLATNPADESY